MFVLECIAYASLSISVLTLIFLIAYFIIYLKGYERNENKVNLILMNYFQIKSSDYVTLFFLSITPGINLIFFLLFLISFLMSLAEKIHKKNSLKRHVSK